MNVGERAGSGMGAIASGWTAAGYPEPNYQVAFGPDRTTLTLPLVSADLNDIHRQKSAEFGRKNLDTAMMGILGYLEKHGPSRRSDLEPVLGLGTSRVNDLLRELVAAGFIVAEGATRSRRYRLADEDRR